MENTDNQLEDRLRGMILSNAGINVGPLLPPSVQSPLPSQTFPNQAENQNPANGTAGRKKLNQSQRRQMSSQLSIPVNPRQQQAQSYGHQQQQQQQMMAPQNMRQHHNHYPPTNHPSSGPQMQRPTNPSFAPQMQRPTNPSFAPQMQHPAQPVYHLNPQGSQLPNRPPAQHRQLFQPHASTGRGPSLNPFNANTLRAQVEFVQSLIDGHVDSIAIQGEELAQKENFRGILQNACREAIRKDQLDLGHADFDATTVHLTCFGSMASGFATKGSDMDLALITPRSMPRPETSDVPRLLEKTLLDLGYGTRLITRTRVPIIKICEKPTKHLMFDLQAERLKYDRSIEKVHKEVDEQEKINQPEGSKTQQKDIVEHKDGLEGNDSKQLVKLSPLDLLHQQPRQLLADYYGLAKRVLYKMGGNDVGLSGGGPVSLDMNMDKVQVLNRVSRAFIRGLSDEALKDALTNINANLWDRENPQTCPVSLSGVYCQAEIERFAKEYEYRPIAEPSDQLEKQCYNAMMEWNKLEWKDSEASVQNTRLYKLLDRVKHINSLQFAVLAQLPHEPPLQYYQRMSRLVHGVEAVSNRLLPIVLGRYVDGIFDDDIQKRLYSIIQGPGKERMGAQGLLFHHSILQLANDYERALSLGLYEKEDRQYVEAYVALLRPSELKNFEEYEHYFSGMGFREAELTAKMKELPDPKRPNKPRDRYQDHLSFPCDDSVGIQCDINFAADLALHNTHLLRCYEATDRRVRPLVLFVKSWASRRGINTPYRGTLSSYGYVLMVLHYLANVAVPPVIPNLQMIHHPHPAHLTPAEIADLETCNGLNVRFWRDEQEIRNMAKNGRLTKNQDSLGKLLRGFFEYYANNGNGYHGFEWAREVLSLRSKGGILTKNSKDWVGAKTTLETMTTFHSNPNAANGASNPKSATSTRKVEEVKEVRHRYLLAIEDPFEIDHNVGRTVNHDGIVNIRDEFRRAWRIIKDQGNSKEKPGFDLLQEVAPPSPKTEIAEGGYQKLMDAILEGGLSGYVSRGGTVSGYMSLASGDVNEVMNEEGTGDLGGA